MISPQPIFPFQLRLTSVCAFLMSASLCPLALGQATLVAPDGTTVVIQEGGPEGMPPGAMPPGGRPPGGKPSGGEAPPGTGKPGEAGKPGDKKSETPNAGVAEPIKRKSEPPDPPNKREFDVKPDEQGLVQFQFRNQAWPDLMRWLAEVCGMSLDWQELPGDYLNIAAQRKHTLEETRDLINRHLLARGFTMLEFDGTIQVLKTSGINAALVPKVEPRKLASLPPNRFVRVSFSLDTLIAADVVAELKPLISSNGTLSALAATNRLEAMDTAANLSELNRILSEEQSEAALESLAREFVLEHVRAIDVREQLLQFLGLETKKKESMSREQQMMEMQQQQMMMQQQQQQQQAGGGAANKKAKAEIYIVGNVRRNSIIAHAPPDKMAVIAAFVRRVDVPNENADSLESLQARTQVYRLSSLDPKQLVASLVAMDAMEPTTRLEVDEKNKAIIAYASFSDQYTIKKMIERLDGSARDVDVIQLRRLRAEDVVGTIKFLMGNEEKKEDNSRMRYYDPWGNSNSKKDTNTDQFRVAANSQDNQVLIWANEVERAEVQKLLVKLGELPPAGGSASRVRVIDANRSSETKEYLKRLQEAWSKISPTPLELPKEDQFDAPDAKKEPAADKEKDPKDSAKKKKEDEPVKEKVTNAVLKDKEVSQTPSTLRDQNLARLGIPTGRFSASNQTESQGIETVGAVNNDDEGTPKEELGTPKQPSTVRNPLAAKADSEKTSLSTKAPIQIAFDERGNLVLRSDDTDALSKLEQLMIDNAPPQRGYEVYAIKHSKPSWIKWNLEDYYKEEKKDNNNNNSFMRFFFDMDAPTEKKTDDAQLGKKRKLRFLSDNDTNSLIVIGADDAQLKNIEGLIRLWDVPEKTNKQRLRFTKLVKVEYSKAEGIVEAIKEAYRDLLSTNDKAFQKEKEGGGADGKEPKRSDSSDAIFDGGMNFSFSGRLSLGVDKITNSIIVCAEGEDLLTLILDMIKELDMAAMPSESVEILKLDGANSQAMEKALTAWSKANNVQVQGEMDPAQQQQMQQQQQALKNANGNRSNPGNQRKK
jgi:hypothetical protein